MRSSLMVALAVMRITVVMIVFQEEVLVCAVGSESDGCDAEARKETLEAVETAEWPSVSPGLTGNR